MKIFLKIKNMHILVKKQSDKQKKNHEHEHSRISQKKIIVFINFCKLSQNSGNLGSFLVAKISDAK